VRSKDIEKVKSAIKDAQTAGVDAANINRVEEALKELEAEALLQKRVKEMNDAIASAERSTEGIEKIQAAMAAAKEAGAEAADIAKAEKEIHDIKVELNRKKMVQNMADAYANEDIDALKAAMSEARDGGVDKGEIARFETGLHKLEVEVEQKVAMAALTAAVMAGNIEDLKAALAHAKEIKAKAAKAKGNIRASISKMRKSISGMVPGHHDEISDAEKRLKELEKAFDEAKKKLTAAMDNAKKVSPPTVDSLRTLKEAEEEAKPLGVDTKAAEALHESLLAALAAAKAAAEEEMHAAVESRIPQDISEKIEGARLFGSEEPIRIALDKVAEMIQADMVVAHAAEREDKGDLLPPIEALLNIYRVQAPGCHILRKMHNDMQDLKGALRVFCRIRPLNKRELGLNDTIVVEADSEMDVHVTSSKGDRNDFSYDAIFGADNSQADVFEECRSLIQSSFDGYNITIFTYGQTGAGKTWTLYGCPEQPGVSPRTCLEVFEVVRRQEEHFEFDIQVSMVELYNSKVRDLLSSEKTPPELDIKQAKGPCGEAIVKIDCVKVPAFSTPDLEKNVMTGFGNRKVASTSMNADSSRSHLMVMIAIQTTEKATGKVKLGKITIVDLAGSERLAKSQVTGDAQKEAIEINKSLTALGDVMGAITSKAKMIPYRNHKLTQLMQDSLGGTAKTLMFVNISPASNNADETINALKYASRARSIENETGPAKGAAKSKAKAKAKGK